jgi:probable addiction module antidote protein
MRRSRPFTETLREVLSDPEDAAAFLSVALEEGDPGVFLLALKDVARIHGGIGKIARRAKLNRESLYRMLSKNGNPTVNSLNALLRTLGFRLSIVSGK